MASRPWLASLRCTAESRLQLQSYTHRPRRYATLAAVTPAPHIKDAIHNASPIQRYHPSQPPSFKPPELRKSQLHRQYTSLLRSSPLILVFQHNNLRASEFNGIRRELALAMRRADIMDEDLDDQADGVRLQVIQSGVFAAALRVVEFFKHKGVSQTEFDHAAQQQHDLLSHDLSKMAHLAAIPRTSKNKGVKAFKRTTPLHRMLSGPIAILSFPSVSSHHLAAAISILLPVSGVSSAFSPPKRKTNPGYYEGPVQSGLQKLLLLGARVEGRILDGEGVKWVGGIEGGINGLRAQLVHTLQSAGISLTRTLGGAGNALWLTVDSRRLDMEALNQPTE